MALLSESVVLDASALIALARREKGWEQVASFGLACDLSAVNLVEVSYRLTKHGLPLEAVDSLIRPMIGNVIPFDESQALVAASVHAQTRQYGLSLADCACLALGLTRGATVVTADRQWKSLGLSLNIVQCR